MKKINKTPIKNEETIEVKNFDIYNINNILSIGQNEEFNKFNSKIFDEFKIKPLEEKEDIILDLKNMILDIKNDEISIFLKYKLLFFFFKKYYLKKKILKYSFLENKIKKIELKLNLYKSEIERNSFNLQKIIEKLKNYILFLENDFKIAEKLLFEIYEEKNNIQNNEKKEVLNENEEILEKIIIDISKNIDLNKQLLLQTKMLLRNNKLLYINFSARANKYLPFLKNQIINTTVILNQYYNSSLLYNIDNLNDLFKVKLNNDFKELLIFDNNDADYGIKIPLDNVNLINLKETLNQIKNIQSKGRKI